MGWRDDYGGVKKCWPSGVGFRWLFFRAPLFSLIRAMGIKTKYERQKMFIVNRLSSAYFCLSCPLSPSRPFISPGANFLEVPFSFRGGQHHLWGFLGESFEGYAGIFGGQWRCGRLTLLLKK